MWSIVGTRAIKQAAIRFPIKPSDIERPVGEADEFVINRLVVFEQHIAHRTGVKLCRGLHHAWIMLSNLVMAQTLIGVIADAYLESVETIIDEKPVAAGLHAGKRHLEQIR